MDTVAKITDFGRESVSKRFFMGLSHLAQSEKHNNKNKGFTVK